MSKCHNFDGPWCFQCQHYNAIICGLAGICKCNYTTHCEHVIGAEHVACKHFEVKE